jgi:uncharacterized protein YhjY with autotransporter beta-barrel domain
MARLLRKPALRHFALVRRGFLAITLCLLSIVAFSFQAIAAPQAATLVLNQSSYSSAAGEAVTFTVQVVGDSPTGSVELFDGAASLGTAVIAGGSASFNISSLTVGSHSIKATYGGDANNSAADPAFVDHTVTGFVVTLSITAVSPSSGSTNGGTNVTITGTGFTGTTVVTFGGVAASSYAVVNDTTLTAVSPAHGAGTVDIGLQRNDGASASGAGFTYIAPVVIAITPDTLPGGQQGKPYDQALSATGGAAPYSFAISSGALPPGLSLASDGHLTGIPTALGSHAFAVTATDANSVVSAPHNYTVLIASRPDPTTDPEVMGLLMAQADQTRRLATTQMDNFASHTDNLHDRREVDESGVNFVNGVTLSFADDCRVQPENPDCKEPQPAFNGLGLSPNASARKAATTIWTAGSISFGKKTDDADYEFTTSGLSAGIDHRISQAFTLGAGAGYGFDRADVGDNGTNSRARAYTVAIYSSYHPGQSFFVDGLVGYQWLSFKSHRYITGSADDFATGSRDGEQWFASLKSGVELPYGDWLVTPYGGIDITRAKLDPFTEDGDPTTALHVLGQTVETTTAKIGLDLKTSLETSLGLLSPSLRLEYQHDFQGDGDVLIGYADGLGPLYQGNIGNVAQDRLLLRIGADRGGQRLIAVVSGCIRTWRDGQHFRP